MLDANDLESSRDSGCSLTNTTLNTLDEMDLETVLRFSSGLAKQSSFPNQLCALDWVHHPKLQSEFCFDGKALVRATKSG